MSTHIPRDFIDNLVERLDIVEVIGGRIKLKKSGKNYSACCPFHHEKTPSFNVNTSKNFYHCFGCGASGNAINFVMEYERLSFVEAVESLAASLGLQIPYTNKHQKAENAKSTKPIYAVLEAAQISYRKALKEHVSRNLAITYLQQRGFNSTIAKEFGVGFAPSERNFISLSLAGKHEQQHLQEAGLLGIDEENKRTYDRFRGRIMFPIKDRRGRIIGFGGRIVGDGKPKYLNSPETVVFHKSRELYGFYEMRQSRAKFHQIIVVEGYLDVISLAQFGMRNVVATLGTAISSEQIKILLRECPHILFCFDGDNAGRKAAWNAVEIAVSQLHDGQQIKLVLLPNESDPDSFIRDLGKDKFEAYLVNNSINLSDYLFDYLSADLDLNSVEGKAHLSQKASLLINQVKGQNLRLLLQQKLSQITGLEFSKSDNPINLPPNFGADEPPFTDYVDDFAPNYDNYEQFTPSLASDNYRKKVIPSQLSKKKSHVKVLNKLAAKAIKLLLLQPSLAVQDKQAIENFMHTQEQYQQEFITDETQQKIILLPTLLTILKILTDDLNLNSMQLLARWHATEQGVIVQNILQQEFALDTHIFQLEKAQKSIDLASEFKDTLKQIIKLQNILYKQNQTLKMLLEKLKIAD